MTAMATKENMQSVCVETQCNSFDLRMYDPTIGRWLSRGPMGQYHSPYVGMGNDPINGVDPDGGSIWKPDSEGNLIAKKGDNARTLAHDLHISIDEADNMINN
jgi:RHS repeat-associated protein